MRNWHPERIPIMREKDYHTHYLGELEDGRLFFGYETFVFPGGYSGGNWQEERVEYAIVYLFDSEGNHVETLHELVGKTSEIELGKSNVILKGLLDPLGKLNFRNIEVKPFQTEIDGVVFGLVPNAEYETVDLEPNSTISFHEPWDGEYDT